MSRSNTSDHLGQNHGLAQTSTSEEPGLTTADEGSQQVNNLDPGFENFRLGRQILEQWRLTMDRPAFFVRNIATTVDRFAQNVEHSPQSSLAHGKRQRLAGIDNRHATTHAVCAAQSNAANSTSTKMLLNFAGHLYVVALDRFFDRQSIVDLWQMAFRKTRRQTSSQSPEKLYLQPLLYSWVIRPAN